MSILNLANVINVSVATAQQGLGKFNTSNLAIFTSETPLVSITDYKIYLTASEVATDFGSSSKTAKMASAIFSQSPNILTGGGYLVVIPLLALEKLDAAIIRTKTLVNYFGILATSEISDADLLLAAAQVQSVHKILFAAKRLAADVNTGGIADQIKTASYYKTRILLYLTSATTDEASVIMAAAYAGRALSVDFSGSNTTQTMHLKDLTGIAVDSSMTQTILDKCKTVGADVYASFQGVAKTFTSGANKFFDQVYNQTWFVSALEIAGFNYLAKSSSKIAQTENGVSGLKGAYRKVLEQAITNQYIAAGSWTSPDTFGVLEDFQRNISERGYYLYSLPVSQQSQVDRESRIAPLIQIALKEAGGIHSSNVIVYVNP